MSISSCSASLRTPVPGRTWKPMMMAFEAAASITSVSVMAPTPAWTMSTATSSFDSLSSASESASTEPPTSAFTTRLSLLICRWPAAREVVEGDVAALVHGLLALELHALGGNFPRLALVVDHDEAVAGLGAPLKPRTWTGVLGPASSPLSRSSNMARTRPSPSRPRTRRRSPACRSGRGSWRQSRGPCPAGSRSRCRRRCGRGWPGAPSGRSR